MTKELFPTDTVDTLLIAFPDGNDALTFRQIVRRFTTGNNETETHQLLVISLSTRLWDNDNDGVSNFDEATAGTDSLLKKTRYPRNETSTVCITSNLFRRDTRIEYLRPDLILNILKNSRGSTPAEVARKRSVLKSMQAANANPHQMWLWALLLTLIKESH